MPRAEPTDGVESQTTWTPGTVEAASAVETYIADDRMLDAAEGAVADTIESTEPQNSDGETQEPAGRRRVLVERPEGIAAMDLVFVTSECEPYSKSGGLADVMGSLPEALAARGHRVMVVTPRYDNYPGALDTGHRCVIHGAEVGFFHEVKNNVDYVFIDHPSYQRPGGLYGDAHGTYGDNQWRYKLMCLAALEAPLQLELGEDGVYGENCVFIANDWHAGLVPVYVAAHYRRHGTYRDARTVLAIHNLRYQGVFPPATFSSLGLPDEWYGALEWQYPPHLRSGAYEEEGRAVNTLKGAIATADRIVTVSPTFSQEIQTPQGGWGMEWMLGSRRFVVDGVLNGVDEVDWNPATDTHLPRNYGVEDVLEGKAACKRELQKE